MGNARRPLTAEAGGVGMLKMTLLYHLARLYYALRNVVRCVVESPFVRLFAFTAVILLAYHSLWPAPEPRAELRNLARSDRVLAWTVLTSPAPGPSGKRQALEFLHALGDRLEGLDLACVVETETPCTVDLSGADLGALKGRGVALGRARLDGVDLSAARLQGAELRGASLRSAILREADLSAIKAPEADFSGADLFAATFTDAVLSNALFDGARLDAAVFSGARLDRSRLIGASLRRARFNDADLRNADLRGALLAGARFEGAALNLATLRGANVSDVDFSGAAALETAFAGEIWAWRDQPPKGVSEEMRVILCEPGEGGAIREAFEAAFEEARRSGDAPPKRPEACRAATD